MLVLWIVYGEAACVSSFSSEGCIIERYPTIMRILAALELGLLETELVS